MALEKQLEGTRVTKKGDISSQVAPPSLKMVSGGKQCASRSTDTPTKICSADLYRHIKRRVGRSLKLTHCKGNLVPSRKQVTQKPSRTKGSLSGPKRVPRPLLFVEIVLVARQHYSRSLYKQRRGDEGGPSVCPSVENPDLVSQETGNSQNLTHPSPAECDSRQTIQDRSDHPERMVPSPIGLPSHMLHVATAPSGPVCHQVQQQTATVVSPVPDPQEWAVDALCPDPYTIQTHMPSHQQPSWAKWWRSFRTTHATGSYWFHQSGPTCPGLGPSGHVQSDPVVM